MERITSFQNAKIKLAKKLHSKRHREREGLFLIDYARDLERALAQGYEIGFALYAPDAADDETRALIATLDNAQIYEVAPEMLQKAGYRKNPSGIVAVMQQRPTPTDLSGITSRHVLGLVNLQKPGNIGALLRTADAAGFDNILLIDTALDLYNPNLIRSSTGACFLGNVYSASTQTALAFLQNSGYQIVSGHLEGSTSLFDIDFSEKSAVILGTEDTGLQPIWAENCTHRVQIPMVGKLSDSLNVSVSGAIFMYEALRQAKDDF